MDKQKQNELYSRLVDAQLVRDDAWRQVELARHGDARLAPNRKMLEQNYKVADQYYQQCHIKWQESLHELD